MLLYFFGVDALPAVYEFTMSENLKSIGTHAFDGCANLSKVSFADTAETKFGDYVFANTGVTAVTIPGWIDTVPVGIFNNCLKLNSLTLSEGITETAGSAFANTALKTVVFPEICLYIGDSVFQNAPVTSVTFGSKTLSIGANVFVKDTHFDLMVSVIIPESVKSIGEGAFGYYKDSDKTYVELCAEAEKLGVSVQSFMKPTEANHDFILYGGTAAKRYAEENGMIYGGVDSTDIITTTTTTTTTSTDYSTELTTTTTTNATSTDYSTELTTGTTTSATSSSTSDTDATTTATAAVSASLYEMSNWAKNDYYKKTGVSGIGRLLPAIAAFLMIGFGVFAVRTGKRKREDTV